MADEHLLGSVEFMRYNESARQLVANLGHFYTTGRLPNGGALSETRLYRMRKGANAAGSYRDIWTITIIGGMLGNVLGTYATRAVDYGFDQFVQDAVGSAVAGKPATAPPEWKTDDVLRPLGNTNVPYIATELERHQHWLDLRERLNGILPYVSRPVGRSADRLAIHVDDKLVGVIDERVLHRLLQPQVAAMQMEITSAVKGLRRPS